MSSKLIYNLSNNTTGSAMSYPVCAAWLTVVNWMDEEHNLHHESSHPQYRSAANANGPRKMNWAIPVDPGQDEHRTLAAMHERSIVACGEGGQLEGRGNVVGSRKETVELSAKETREEPTFADPPLTSHAQSVYSLTPSTRPILTDVQFPLEPPAPLFADEPASAPASPHTDSTILPKVVSLSVNYLPNKFSPRLLSPTPRRRKPGKANDDHPVMHKRPSRAESPVCPQKATKTTTASPVVGLVVKKVVTHVPACTGTGSNVHSSSPILQPHLLSSHMATEQNSFSPQLPPPLPHLLPAGILLNNHSFLAVYTFALWLCFALLVTPGYMTYKQRTFNLEGTTNAQWSRGLGAEGRLRIQNKLHCCLLRPLSPPGCKEAYINFEKRVLYFWYTIAFSLVPLQLVIMLAGLLCSNHVTYRFGKGTLPKAYRLSMTSMTVIMDNYARWVIPHIQLVEQYGTEVASDIVAWSRHLDSTTYTSGVANGTSTTYALSHGSCLVLLAARTLLASLVHFCYASYAIVLISIPLWNQAFLAFSDVQHKSISESFQQVAV
ncbi:hypothetical protein EV702DRAFT_1270544 [Suillus placidus]|uniref:Uncharacterized protein n=1 Tax=Suillus placidus TaxID=48579 RepID=A0A9P6ZPJ8_9AGAM|nr:hypothetical protein EV702DRAFT_1270544 [Suillus placidus]